MGWVSGLVVYAVIWWVVIFTVLPWGVRRQANPVPGSEPGAPEAPMLGRKMLWTSAISAVIWLIVYALVNANLFSFRDLAERMPT